MAVKTIGDGNCFYRAISRAYLGTDGYHEEMCLKTAVYMFENDKALQKKYGRRFEFCMSPSSEAARRMAGQIFGTLQEPQKCYVIEWLPFTPPSTELRIKWQAA